MAERGTLKGLTITMKIHPSSLKVGPKLKEKLAHASPDQETLIFEGK
jgi:hypothetical protein